MFDEVNVSSSMLAVFVGIIVILLVVVIALAALGATVSVAFQPDATYTPYPTYTPAPTYTPQPVSTLEIILIPIEPTPACRPKATWPGLNLLTDPCPRGE